MKKFLSLFLACFVLCASLVTPTFAYESGSFEGGLRASGGWSSDGRSTPKGSNSSTDTGSGEIGTGDTEIFASPALTYSNLLPTVSTVVSEYETPYWLVFRSPANASDAYTKNYDGTTTVDFSGIEWNYYLVFFSEDLSFDFYLQSTGNSTGSLPCQHYIPQLQANASQIHVYKMTWNNGNNSMLTDTELQNTTETLEWTYLNSYYDGTYKGFSNWIVGEMINDDASLQETLDNMFVASSFWMFMSSSGPWEYLAGPYVTIIDDEDITDVHDEDGLASFYMSGFGWEITYYSEVDMPAEDEIFWLKKIYYAMVDGFKSILEKITGTSSDAQNDINKDLGQDDDGNGFNFLSIVKKMFEAILSVIGGFWKILVGGLTTILDGITNFFDLIGDGASDLFKFFNGDGEETPFAGVTSFFEFVAQLWLCIPAPVQYLFYMGFGFTCFFVVLKMFH